MKQVRIEIELDEGIYWLLSKAAGYMNMTPAEFIAELAAETTRNIVGETMEQCAKKERLKS